MAETGMEEAIQSFRQRIADLEAENKRLKDYITRRSRDQYVQCCVSHELVASWDRDKG